MIQLRQSKWSIDGSYGETGTAGTPTLKIQIGASRLVLPVSSSDGKKATLRGVGGGLATGISPEFPWTDWVNVTVSTESMPSTGSPIFVLSKSEYSAKDFAGFVTVVAGGGTYGFLNGGGALALWHRSANIEECISSGPLGCNLFKAGGEVVLQIHPAGQALSVHAAGFIAGAAVSTDLIGAGVSLFKYRFSVT